MEYHSTAEAAFWAWLSKQPGGLSLEEAFNLWLEDGDGFPYITPVVADDVEAYRVAGRVLGEVRQTYHDHDSHHYYPPESVHHGRTTYPLRLSGQDLMDQASFREVLTDYGHSQISTSDVLEAAGVRRRIRRIPAPRREID